MKEPAVIKENLFKYIFEDIFIETQHKKYIENAVVQNIEFYKNSNEAIIYIISDVSIPAAALMELEDKIKEKMEANYAEIIVIFNNNSSIEELIYEYKEKIVKFLNMKVAMSRTILADSKWEITQNIINITLNTSGTQFLKAKSCDKLLEEFIYRNFKSSYKIQFIDTIKPYDEENDEYIKQKSEIEKDIVAEVFNELNKSKNKTDKQKNNSGSNYGVITGKPFTDEIIKISEINDEVHKAAIYGKIISIDSREIKGGKTLLSFDVYDEASSITAKMFLSKEKTNDIMPKLIVNKWIKVRGNVQYDKFSKEITIMASDILEADFQEKRDDAEVKRAELHLHTQMSAMDAVTPTEDMIKRAAFWGHKAIAITDHGVVQAYPEAYAAGKKYNIKIIYGVECYLIDDELKNPKDTKSYHAIILVKNQIGLKNLYKIISESHIKYFYKKPRVPKNLYKKYHEGLMIGTACEAGELYTAILNKKSDAEIENIIGFYDYLEVQPLGNNNFLIKALKVKDEQELIDINKKIIDLGEQYNKPVVATCDAHFLDESDEVFRRILMAGQGYEDADNQAPLYFRTTDEMLAEFKYLDKEKAYEIVVTNTNLISDMIEDIIPIPQKTFSPKIEGAEKELETLALTKAKEIYGDPLPDIVKTRLDKELNSIIKNGFAVMYIIAQKLVSKSLNDGYLVGSRGSVGSSFAATMAGITEVNPLPAHYVCDTCKYTEFIKEEYDCGIDMPDKNCPNCNALLHKGGYNIPFETFLGFEGDKEPDIDLNFSGDYQPKAHKYIEELFGEGHIFRAGTISTIADRTAYGFVKNYLSEKNIRALNAEINRLVKGCTGVKKTTGQHPGGVMIVPQDNDIYEFCPIQHPADDKNSGVITTHFDYHSIHGTLLKLDILGHDDPTVIRMLEDLTGVNALKIPIGDKDTMAIFTGTKTLGVTPESINSEVGTLGIPEFGTKFVRQILIDTKPTTFLELVKISGLSHGTDVWLNNAQDIIRDGTAKLSEVICTRDDIMLYLINKGIPPKTAFKIMEDVRKGKGLKPEYEKMMKENNVPDWYSQSCNKIKYMFPKAHAVAYVIMAFRVAYFKVHYPEAFYVAYFTVRGDDFDAELMTNGPERVNRQIKELELKGNNLTAKEKNILILLEVVNEMYQRNIKFLPVDLYKSHPVKFLLEDTGIRPPLNSLQGLGTVAAENIAQTRKKAKFLSKDDLRIRAKVSKAVIEILQNYGCINGMPESNQLSLF